MINQDWPHHMIDIYNAFLYRVHKKVKKSLN